MILPLRILGNLKTIYCIYLKNYIFLLVAQCTHSIRTYRYIFRLIRNTLPFFCFKTFYSFNILHTLYINMCVNVWCVRVCVFGTCIIKIPLYTNTKGCGKSDFFLQKTCIIGVLHTKCHMFLWNTHIRIRLGWITDSYIIVAYCC
jgi:hypothetical protein